MGKSPGVGGEGPRTFAISLFVDVSNSSKYVVN